MGYSDTQIQAILSNTIQLKGLFARLLSSTAATVLPTVDFAVDIFDRPDSGVLTGYWQDEDGNWGLRNNRAICQAGTTSNTTIQSSTTTATAANPPVPPGDFSTSGSSTYEGKITGGATVPFVGQTRANNLYAAKISSKDINVEVKFELTTASLGSVATVVTNLVSGNTDTAKNLINLALGNTAGAVFGNVGGRFLGVATSFGILPDITAQNSSSVWDARASQGPASISSVSSVGQTATGFTVFAGNLSDSSSFSTALAGSFTSGTTLNTVNTTGDFALTQGVSRITTSGNFLSPPSLNIGANTLLVTAVGDTYNIYINGVLLLTKTTAVMIDRSMAGITGYAMNVLGAIIENGFSYAGITSFRVWIAGGADPGHQSGHGTYAGGYSDKYHSGGVYNPLA